MTLDGSAHLLELLDIQWPIIQAPMAGAARCRDHPACLGHESH
jgi:hypothetical protein